MSHFLCIGDTMMDISVAIDSHIQEGGDTQGNISTQGGGAAANVATWLASLENDVYLCSRVGDDLNGEYLLTELDLYRVRHSSTRAAHEKTGVVVVIVNENGERTMFPDSGANSGLSASDLPPLTNFTATYLSGYALINPKSRKGVMEMVALVKAQSIPIVLDPGTVGALRNIPAALLTEWISQVDILILNEEEALFISKEENLRDALIKLATFTPLVVIKRGENGAIGMSNDSAIVEVAAPHIEVVDTTGAGDSFAAGFMSAWFTQRDLETAIVGGVTRASICIAAVGARPPLT